ncbi:formate/nitrite transporter family protein [Clostridiaceae bacterium 68-1-5]|uniref:Formate/nitrite transporter family protein n=1 Tax=Suipraeoptans intestinalis TaxID=2606628 RepID=A0A6N7V143_9FIRM|nr:formate/nitrite transporter family protein [Suipraeoptans intestinalis]MSR93850.1 formate/nitrite transporter family protein [Suipraeoptans intestinalis]
MFQETIDSISSAAVAKAHLWKHHKKSYLISSMLAGSFIGIGGITSFTSASLLDAAGSAWTRLIMAATFCIALTLVVFTGTELFTGNNYVMTIGWLNKATRGRDAAAIWLFSWIGNFLGAILLSVLYVGTGAVSSGSTMEFFSKIAAVKAYMPLPQLFFRAVLCNFLVCLAIVVSNRTKNDAAKILLIVLCLFSFVISGFEHSIANMTVFSIALLEPSITSVSLPAALISLLVATLGNMAGGIVLVGFSTFALKTEK